MDADYSRHTVIGNTGQDFWGRVQKPGCGNINNSRSSNMTCIIGGPIIAIMFILSMFVILEKPIGRNTYRTGG